MNSKEWHVLLRVSAELLTRSSSTRQYLGDLAPGDVGEYGQLITTIKHALARIEQEFYATIEAAQQAVAGGVAEKEACEVFLSFLRRFSRWFATVHELLVYLPAQSVKAEAFTALNSSFGPIYQELSPSIILGSLFNALEFDFLEILSARLPDLNEIVILNTKNIVLQLPICDYASPSAWAILAHEMGHAVDLHHEISQKVVGSFVHSTKGYKLEWLHAWAREICADLIAATAMGPSSILAILSLEYCFYPQISLLKPSETHPTTSWRLEAVSAFLQRKYGVDYLSREKQFYKDAWECNLLREIADPAEQERVRERHGRQYSEVILPIAEKLEQEVDLLSIPPHVLAGPSLERCSRRLEEGLPISAQGLPRSELRMKIDEYRRCEYPSSSEKIDAFKKLVAQFEEHELDVPIILISCYERRLQLLARAVDELSCGDLGAVSNLCTQLAILDSLVASSINTSAVHKLSKSRMAIRGNDG